MAIREFHGRIAHHLAAVQAAFIRTAVPLTETIIMFVDAAFVEIE